MGIPLPWPTNNVPQGFILHDGSKFDTNEYPLLAQRYPNGVITDLRGYFIRGLDTTNTVDNYSINTPRPILSAEEGSYTLQDNQHFHNTVTYSGNNLVDVNWDKPISLPTKLQCVGSTPFGFWQPYDNVQVGVTRPKNIAYNYISFTGKSLPNTSLSLYENNAIDFKNTLTLESTLNGYSFLQNRLVAPSGFPYSEILGWGPNNNGRIVTQTFIVSGWQEAADRHITFPQAFANGCTPCVFMTSMDAGAASIQSVTSVSNTGFNFAGVWFSSSNSNITSENYGAPGNYSCTVMAIGTM